MINLWRGMSCVLVKMAPLQAGDAAFGERGIVPILPPP